MSHEDKVQFEQQPSLSADKSELFKRAVNSWNYIALVIDE